MPSYKLFDDPNDRIVPRDSEESIDRRFREFHVRNPRVYETLVKLARQAKQEGRHRIGIKMLWEVCRWNLSRDLPYDESYKLPNDFHGGRAGPGRHLRGTRAAEHVTFGRLVCWLLRRHEPVRHVTNTRVWLWNRREPIYCPVHYYTCKRCGMLLR